MKVLLIASSIGKTSEEVRSSFIFDEAFRLAGRGLEVHIVRGGFTSEDGEVSYGMYFYGLGRKKYVGAVRTLFSTIGAYPLRSLIRSPKAIYFESFYVARALEVAKRVRPDVIHAHFAYPEGLVGCMVKKKVDKPLVVTVHGYDILVEPSVGYGVRLSKRYDLLVRKVLYCADAIICNSKTLYDEVLKVVNNKDIVKLIYHGVDLKLFTPMDRNMARTRLNLPVNTHIIFTAKHHWPQYGIEYLIRSIPGVVSKVRDVLFVIGGDGPLRAFHESLARSLGVSDYVIFVGQIPRGLMPYYYASSDIVVVPSLQESWGLIATEAMASARPVIASNVGGLREQVIDGFNGFLVPPRDPKAIADRILYFLENSSEVERMGLNGRRLAEERFDIERRIDRILEVYASISSRSP